MPTSRGIQAEQQLGHTEALRARHASLSLIIKDEQNHPSASDLDIHQLKKEKLRLKDAIERRN